MKSTIFFIIVTATSHVWATLSGQLFVPQNYQKKSAKLLVVVHGCHQSAKIMEKYTGWNDIAENEGWIVYYPQVPKGTHPLDCWSWYLEENQKKDSGQLKFLMDEMESVKKDFLNEDTEVHIMGISSGAITVASLIACYPSYFKTGTLHSGVSYGLASNEKEAIEVLKKGPGNQLALSFCDPKSYQGQLFVIHGLKDNIVNPVNIERIIEDFVGDAVSEEADGIERMSEYKIFKYKKNDFIKAQILLVNELSHSWGASKNQAKKENYFEPIGPSSTEMIWNFIKDSESQLKSSSDN